MPKSTLNQLLEVANLHNAISSKIGLKDALGFLTKFSHKDNKSDNNCSSESVSSSNIDRNAMSFNESTPFTELFLKLMHKNWKDKLSKINCYAEEASSRNPKRQTKLLEKLEFIAGHVLLIGTCCYGQSGLVLISNPKEHEESWDATTIRVRFYQHIKLHCFEEFRLSLSKFFKLPMEKNHNS